MPDEKPVSLLKLAFRFALWLFVATLMSSIIVIAVGLLNLAGAPDSALMAVIALATAGFILLMLVVAFVFGRNLRRDHGLEPDDAAMVGLGGTGLLILLGVVDTLWDLHTGEEEPNPEGLVPRVVLVLIGWAAVSAAAALGAWWEGRTATGRNACPTNGGE